MKKSPRDSFVPLAAGPPAARPGFQDARLTVVPQAAHAQPFQPTPAPKADAIQSDPLPASPRPCAEPRLTLHREGERVARISVQCACGHVVELACVY